MARYTGPAFKKSRRLGFSTLETGKEFAKGKQRQYAPGQHGQGRVRLSEYGLHLHEKQKLRTIYGMNEKQFKKTFIKASKISGVAGTNFMIMLEQRLDSIVYRMGIAQTRRQSRQLVNHNHVMLNGKKADIPSIQVKVGDIITLKEKSHKNKQIIEAKAQKTVATWLTMDKIKFEAKLDRLPERKELNTEINDSLIVEYYNK